MFTLYITTFLLTRCRVAYLTFLGLAQPNMRLPVSPRNMLPVAVRVARGLGRSAGRVRFGWVGRVKKFTNIGGSGRVGSNSVNDHFFNFLYCLSHLSLLGIVCVTM